MLRCNNAVPLAPHEHGKQTWQHISPLISLVQQRAGAAEPVSVPSETNMFPANKAKALHKVLQGGVRIKKGMMVSNKPARH